MGLTNQMKLTLAAVVIAIFGTSAVTELHRAVYSNDCHRRGGYVTSQLYFFNECGSYQFDGYSDKYHLDEKYKWVRIK